ncbi:MAG: EFR1 family ferrodoxin, partial [Lachnospiraceae bacterium]|nr:EFR1 family ferrodoxin [Lachnospiraceae bacterium]
MIIYFTGTGNSEYAAKAMADILGDEAFCCNSAIKNKASVTFSSEKPYLFVFPVYLSTSPAIFRDFIKSCKFTGNKDAYFVPTCASSDGSVPNASMDLCLETGFLNYKGCRKICMPQNYIAFFETFDETKIQNCIQNADESISEICA